MELKARDRDPAASLRTCEALGAEDRGILIQEDTYFDVPRGRLKLREEGKTSHLIAYQRPDCREQRESRYRVVRVEDADGLREALAAALGVLVVVSKERRLFVFEGVRIHLDRVDELGGFIEFEGVLGSAAGSVLADFGERLSELRRRFGIGEDDLLAESYSDLALAHART